MIQKHNFPDILCFMSFEEEGGGKSGLLPGAHLCPLLVSAAPEPDSEEDGLPAE